MEQYLIEENDYYKDLRLELEMKNYLPRFKTDLKDRVKTYEKQLETCVTPSNFQCNTQKDFMVDLMHDYACLTSSGEKNKRECLRHLESKLSEGPPVADSQAGVELDDETVGQIYKALGKTKEAKFLERQKLVSEQAFVHPWTDVETLSLLRGVAKYGEHSWSEICDKYSFQSFRTTNSLAYKWSKLKSNMLQDIQKIHTMKGISISKWDWIQCCIHKLEVKCGYFNSRQPSSTGLSTPFVRFTHTPRQSWAQRGHLHAGAISQGRVIGTPVGRSADRMNSIPHTDAVQSETRNKENLHQESLTQDKKQSALQQLCDNYMECMNRFRGTIDTGKFNLDDVRRYIAGKEATPVYPKYFELHYAPRPTSKAEETPKRPVFKLHAKEDSKEEVKAIPEVILEQSKEIQAAKPDEPVTKSMLEPELKKLMSVPVTLEERIKAEQKKDQHTISLKKMFIQKKKAQLSNAGAKEDAVPQNESQTPLNN